MFSLNTSLFAILATEFIQNLYNKISKHDVKLFLSIVCEILENNIQYFCIQIQYSVLVVTLNRSVDKFTIEDIQMRNVEVFTILEVI